MKTLTVVALTLLIACWAGCKSTTVEGTGGQKLTIEKPAPITLERGSMAKVTIKIVRTNLAGPVSVKFDMLPAGVEVVDSDQKILGDEAVYTLKASDSADLVANYVAHVKATADSGIGATEVLNVTVKEKK
jgi:hypothetical protein